MYRSGRIVSSRSATKAGSPTTIIWRSCDDISIPRPAQPRYWKISMAPIGSAVHAAAVVSAATHQAAVARHGRLASRATLARGHECGAFKIARRRRTAARHLFKADQVSAKASRRLGTAFQRLQQMDVVKLLVLGEQPFDMKRVLSFAGQVPYFVSEITSLGHSRLPLGTEIVMVSPSQSLNAENLVPRVETPRIYLMDQEAFAPNGQRLIDVFGGRTLTLDQFQTRVAQ